MNRGITIRESRFSPSAVQQSVFYVHAQCIEILVRALISRADLLMEQLCPFDASQPNILLIQVSAAVVFKIVRAFRHERVEWS